MVLDDGTESEAVVPRRDGGPLPSHGGGPGGEPDRRVRAGDEHNKWRAGVRNSGRQQGQRPDRLLQEIRPVVRGGCGVQLGLCQSKALLGFWPVIEIFGHFVFDSWINNPEWFSKSAKKKAKSQYISSIILKNNNNKKS